ncbi:tetratricopeptide repeat protein [Variovorax sp. ZT5P49]|uniref:tetratricopeptide repeat protein n=1 Tax=Variovorax sp. ZT5P49 TaxID=3443733 RepID=UPI003F475686
MKRTPNPNRRPALTQQALNALGTQFRAAFAQGDYAQAHKFATQAWQATHSLQPLADVALCLLRLDQPQQAYHLYRRTAEELKTANAYDGLAEAAGQLGKRDEVRKFGSMSLRLKLQEAASEAAAARVDAPAPRRFDERNRHRNVIAFSLFGSDPRYCEMALLNVRAAREFFPAWTCRFYVDDSVPADVCGRLLREGASVVDVRSIGGLDLPGTMWRFLALDDPGVDRVQFRDADSLLSTRDQAAVRAWCASDRWFHVMRDYHSHTELMLAGMWGACAGIFWDMAGDMRAYLKSRPFSARYADQHFLRHRVWKVAERSMLAHDEWFDLPGNQPFPAHVPMCP